VLTALVQARVALRGGRVHHHVAVGGAAHGDALPRDHRGLALGSLKLKVQRLLVDALCGAEAAGGE
jgi:hypothetical protein